MTNVENIGYDERSAIAFNVKHCRALGWYQNLPEQAIAAFPRLFCDILGTEEEKRQFTRAVFNLQNLLFEGDDEDCDGKLGRGTLSKMLKTYDPIPDSDRFYLHHRRRLRAPERANICPVITYKDQGGLDLHVSSKRSRKGNRPRWIVIHWSATTSIESCFNVLRNKGISSHFATGLQDKSPVIIQWLDSEYDGAHAGTRDPEAISGNRDSLGIDICSTPSASAEKTLKRKGHNVELKKNETGRGDRYFLTLDSLVARATLELVMDLCAIHEIPFKAPVSEDETGPIGQNFHGIISKDLYNSGSGVIGHHNLNHKKWDVFAPWWDEIFKGE